MLVSDLAGSAAYRAASGEVRAYDDLRCLLDDRAEGVGRDVEPSEIWVHQHETGVAVRASDAAFVRSTELRTPMGGGLAAFADTGAAAAFADQHGGEVLRWSELEAEAMTRPGVATASVVEAPR
jgi:copper chaperone NosL